MQGSPGSPLDSRLAARMQANIRKFYLFQFLLNFQLWWPIWVIYLTEERGLTLGQVTLIDVPFWLSIIALQIPAAAIVRSCSRSRSRALASPKRWMRAVEPSTSVNRMV